MPLARPEVGQRELQLVGEVLASGRLSLGPMLSRFEREFAQQIGDVHAVAVSSGTAGLHLAIRACGVAPGDEVITTPFSFISSANVMLFEQAKPVFVDIDPVTLNIDQKLIAGAVTDKSRGILPVHIFGYPIDIQAVGAIAADHDLWVVEDACEALGARHADGKPVGSSGNLAVYGFYPNKQMTTGEGGMVTAPTAELAGLVSSERNQGRAPDMGWLDHNRLGFNYRMSDVSAAIGVAQLERLDAMLNRRSEIAGWYREELAGQADLTLPCEDLGGVKRSWFVFVVQVAEDADRDATIERLRERGVAAKPYLPAIHLQPFYREQFGYGPGDFPVTESIAARSIALPFYTALEREDVARVAHTLGQSLVA